MYTGVTAHLMVRIHQHQHGRGSRHCAHYKLLRLAWAERGDDITALIEHEKRMKRWRREWKFELIEKGNPDWRNLSHLLA
jgi:putative endonuclease